MRESEIGREEGRVHLLRVAQEISPALSLSEQSGLESLPLLLLLALRILIVVGRPPDVRPTTHGRSDRKGRVAPLLDSTP